MYIPGKGWEQEEAALACTPGLQLEPVVPCQTLFHTEQGTLPADTNICRGVKLLSTPNVLLLLLTTTHSLISQ